MKNGWLHDTYFAKKKEEYDKTGERIIFKRIYNPQDEYHEYVCGLDFELNDKNRSIVEKWIHKHGQEKLDYMILKGVVDELTLVAYNPSPDYRVLGRARGELLDVAGYLGLDEKKCKILVVGYPMQEKGSELYQDWVDEGLNIEHLIFTPEGDIRMEL